MKCLSRRVHRAQLRGFRTWRSAQGGAASLTCVCLPSIGRHHQVGNLSYEHLCNAIGELDVQEVVDCIGNVTMRSDSAKYQGDVSAHNNAVIAYKQLISAIGETDHDVGAHDSSCETGELCIRHPDDGEPDFMASLPACYRGSHITDPMALHVAEHRGLMKLDWSHAHSILTMRSSSSVVTTEATSLEVEPYRSVRALDDEVEASVERGSPVSEGVAAPVLSISAPSTVDQTTGARILTLSRRPSKTGMGMRGCDQAGWCDAPSYSHFQSAQPTGSLKGLVNSQRDGDCRDDSEVRYQHLLRSIGEDDIERHEVCCNSTVQFAKHDRDFDADVVSTLGLWRSLIGAANSSMESFIQGSSEVDSDCVDVQGVHVSDLGKGSEQGDDHDQYEQLLLAIGETEPEPRHVNTMSAFDGSHSPASFQASPQSVPRTRALLADEQAKANILLHGELLRLLGECDPEDVLGGPALIASQ